uniref:Uncharacterized protein n=1 Tax=Magallana gigas TaxID=29159 RepID=A0A8W8NVW1_MAGGI|nr:uncharacterized protein LOC117688290 [Crassostrea gigas]
MWMFQTSKALWLLIDLFVQCSSNLHPGFSRLEQGHRLDGSVINSFPEFSFLDCITECLVTPRCASVNYFKGANFCELNYKRKQTAYIQFTESPGWVYSEKDHWPKELAGDCSNSNCSLNEKCVHDKYRKETHLKCVTSDCGIPRRQGLVLTPTKYEDAIGIHRRIHATCSVGYFQLGSGRLTCQLNGEWKYDILCEEKAEWGQYQDHIYRLFLDNLPWADAEKQCEGINGYRAEIGSPDENNWILNFIQNSHPYVSVWIGGNDLQNEGTFIWSRSGQAINWNNWSGSNPDDTDSNENCIEFYTYSTYGGKWNDRSCDTGIRFVCEKDFN